MNKKANSNIIIQESIDNFQTNKHVQFSQNVTLLNKNNQTKLNSSSSFNKTLSSIDENNQPTILSKRVSKNISNPTATIRESTFYRSPNNKFLYLSSSITPSRHSSFLSNTLIEQEYSSNESSSNKDHLSLIEFNSSLSESDQKILEDIRQLIPNEFQKLIPTFIKLGVIILPKTFFQINNQHLTTKQFIERHQIILLIKKDQQNIQHKNDLENLYGSVLPKDNVYHKNLLLREALSFQGQLSLLATYKDQIERELNEKILFWKTIPIDFIKTNHSEYSYSTNRSSLFQIKKKSFTTNSSIKSNNNLSLLTINNYSLPDHIDQQWKQKSIVNIIEQGINLLDTIRSLSSSIYSNQLFIQDNIHHLNFIKAFKRWLFLCSTLYSEFNYID